MAILTQVQEESLRSQGLFPLETGAYLDDGTFSTVIAVSDGSLTERFAVKIVDKMLVMKNDKCKAVLEEKKIHLSLSHPNVVKLFSTFQDEQSLCKMWLFEDTVPSFLIYFRFRFRAL